MSCRFYKKGEIKWIVSLAIVVFLGVMVILAIFNLRVTSKGYLADLIVRDIKRLTSILKCIDKECKILSFDSQKNRIDFLNVKSFVGSEVGAVNLAYPDKWQGPYLDDNPTYQEKEYMVVKTKKGYFVTPGEKVTLPNGKVIGKDIILDEDADIEAMMINDKQLMFENKAMAEKLPLQITTASLYMELPLERI